MAGFEVTELDRRISNLIRIGAIDAVDYANARVRVKSGDILTGWLPWLTQRAGGDITWHAPEIGEQVMILSPSGELNQGAVLPAIYQNLHPAPATIASKHHSVYSDGAIIEYDREAHHLSAFLPEGGTVDINAQGGLTITGDIQLTGTLTASVDVIANGISLHNHKHGQVQSGSDQTGVPV